MSDSFTPETIINLLLACAVILFWGAEKILIAIFRYIQETIGTATPISAIHLDAYGRVSSASAVLRFVSVLVKTTLYLTVGLGVLKIYANVAGLVLPDRTLGFAVLISYCGLVAAFGVVVTEVGEACRQLFSKTSR
jgi:hypothetical protein